jgi:8-oxo-dGTP diphosphatase
VEIGLNPCRDICLATDLSGIAPGPVVRFDGALGPERRPLVVDWELPGGIVEPLEPARLGAAREVREELGVDLQVGRLLVADWIPPHLGWDDAIEMIFDGGTVDENDLIGRCSRRRPRRSPWSTWLRQVSLTPLAFRRLSLAVALGPDEMAYTEEGRIP